MGRQNFNTQRRTRFWVDQERGLGSGDDEHSLVRKRNIFECTLAQPSTRKLCWTMVRAPWGCHVQIYEDTERWSNSIYAIDTLSITFRSLYNADIISNMLMWMIPNTRYTPFCTSSLFKSSGSSATFSSNSCFAFLHTSAVSRSFSCFKYGNRSLLNASLLSRGRRLGR